MVYVCLLPNCSCSEKLILEKCSPVKIEMWQERALSKFNLVVMVQWTVAHCHGGLLEASMSTTLVSRILIENCIKGKSLLYQVCIIRPKSSKQFAKGLQEYCSSNMRHLEMRQKLSSFFNRVVADSETWVQNFEQDWKSQTPQWKHLKSSPKKDVAANSWRWT